MNIILNSDYQITRYEQTEINRLKIFPQCKEQKFLSNGYITNPKIKGILSDSKRYFESRYYHVIFGSVEYKSISRLSINLRDSNICYNYYYNYYYYYNYNNYYYYNYYYYFTPLRVFHFSVSWLSFTEVWVIASFLMSPGLFSVFWPILIML